MSEWDWSHKPEIARLSDGAWGVFCAECSREASDYVYPCARPDLAVVEFPTSARLVEA